MTAPHQRQSVGWRAQVKRWLLGVHQQASGSLTDLGTAARQHAGQFPRSLIVIILGQLLRALAVWIVKNALRDGATEIGISLNDEELSVIADIAVTALAA